MYEITTVPVGSNCVDPHRDLSSERALMKLVCYQCETNCKRLRAIEMATLGDVSF